MISFRSVPGIVFCLIFAAATPFVRAQTLPEDDGLDFRFTNGIAAVVEDKIITVDDVRREIGPLSPQLQRESHNEQEFDKKLEALQNDIIQQLIDRVLIVKEFHKDDKRHVPDSLIDNEIEEQQINEFDGDRSKFLAYL